MCIVVYKPENVEFPSWETLKTCFAHNPNGAGFMWADGKTVNIRKGFMTWNEFKKALKPYKNDSKLPFVMHFRITTHGGTSQGLTHPFPLTASTRKLKELNCKADVGIAHNGIISMCSSAKNLSDTAEFVRDYLTLLVKSPRYYQNHKICDIIEELIGSKMCILSNDMHAEVIGSGWKIDNGIYYSNTSFQKAVVKAGKKKTSGYYGIYDSYSDDYYTNWKGGYEDAYADECCMCGMPLDYYKGYCEVDGYALCEDCAKEYFGENTVKVSDRR